MKFYWDFYGPDGLRTAAHFARHLDEFAKKNTLEGVVSGTEVATPMHAFAHCTAEEPAADTIRRALRPHREEP